MSESLGFKTLGNADSRTSHDSEKSSNILNEFVSSAWRSGVQLPVESIRQLVGLQSEQEPLPLPLPNDANFRIDGSTAAVAGDFF